MARKANRKHFVGGVNVIVAAQSRKQAVDLLNAALTPIVDDWGFARKGDSRAFPQEKEIDPSFFDLKGKVEADESAPDPDPELGEDLEREERRREYEQTFDQLTQ